MVMARVDDSNGTPHVFIGMTRERFERLIENGDAFVVNLDRFGLISGKLVIFFGETDADLTRQVGLVTGEPVEMPEGQPPQKHLKRQN